MIKILDKRTALLEYLQNLPIVQSAEDCMLCEMATLKGALDIADDELIEEYKHYLEFDEEKIERFFHDEYYYQLPSNIQNYGRMCVLLMVAAYIGGKKDLVQKYVNLIYKPNALNNTLEARKIVAAMFVADWCKPITNNAK